MKVIWNMNPLNMMIIIELSEDSDTGEIIGFRNL